VTPGRRRHWLKARLVSKQIMFPPFECGALGTDLRSNAQVVGSPYAEADLAIGKPTGYEKIIYA